jgi:hypothetical protein
MEENKIRTISWSAPSHTHALRSTDWMWGIGLLALVGAGFTFYFHNYVFGIFILISGVAIIMLYSQPSVEINFEINNEGVKVGNSLYLYKNLNGFAVKDTPREILLIETRDYFLPVITIPLQENSANTIRATLSDALEEMELKESRSMQFAERIGL